jgi:hypothetical protein
MGQPGQGTNSIQFGRLLMPTWVVLSARDDYSIHINSEELPALKNKLVAISARV